MRALESVIEKADKEPWTVTVTDQETGKEQEVLFDGETLRMLARGYSGGLEIISRVRHRGPSFRGDGRHLQAAREG
jgi:hypothetical protein